MERPQLTATALQICEQNYKSNCGGCPIRSSCVQRIGAGQDAFNRWITGVNEAAEGKG